jgi:hypothetical protein
MSVILLADDSVQALRLGQRILLWGCKPRRCHFRAPALGR